jgi:hypothetical protein
VRSGEFFLIDGGAARRLRFATPARGGVVLGARRLEPRSGDTGAPPPPVVRLLKSSGALS